MLIEVDDVKFKEEVLDDSSHLVLVDFWAEWCGPCRVMMPIINSIHEEMTEKVENKDNKVNLITPPPPKLKVVKVNIEECPKTREEYSIRSVPTIAVFFKGELLATRTGASSKKQLVDLLEEWIDKLSLGLDSS